MVLAGVLVAQLLDVLSFGVGVARLGVGIEGNALMRSAYDAAGLAGVLFVKGAAVAAVIAMLVAARARFPRFVKLGAAVATALGLVGATVNAIVIAAFALAG
ncbi:MAG: DUF5658 family protein [Chloroflexota bacterium]|nr:DUF5658 family protein [Chloroflexota bacterium]